MGLYMWCGVIWGYTGTCDAMSYGVIPVMSCDLGVLPVVVPCDMGLYLWWCRVIWGYTCDAM